MDSETHGFLMFEPLSSSLELQGFYHEPWHLVANGPWQWHQSTPTRGPSTVGAPHMSHGINLPQIFPSRYRLSRCPWSSSGPLSCLISPFIVYMCIYIYICIFYIYICIFYIYICILYIYISMVLPQGLPTMSFLLSISLASRFYKNLQNLIWLYLKHPGFSDTFSRCLVQ